MKQNFDEIKNLLPFESHLKDLFKKIEELKKLSEKEEVNLEEEIRMVRKRIDAMRQDIFSKLTPLQVVQVARFIMRPTTLDYISLIFEDFIELHGDRNFSDDAAIVAGIAKLDGRSVVVIGHQKGHTTKELIARNFGMANPEGYRKALRIMRMAVRANKPIISLIDTSGAYPGLGAEERGQAEAIAKNLREMAVFTVPFISIITGEGGSGGALGIAMGNRVLMMEYSIYSVISPEGCASILFRDATRAPEAAKASKITAKDLLEFRVIDEIIKEPVGGAHNNYKEAAANVKAAILKHLNEISNFSSRELVADRYNKYRNMGIFVE
ncbi:acetyl-CoA carboxylase carboxyltransferase subunit alpha [candidate division WOR-1 bacterium RIFOXYC2_FULL_37_10]|uniref:Acetyl-coenzyme A carboxylase carboxyl transferase subunit alpha n=1 Tax=candidate division WOR-1 bacterium RIFOXYB2_FULL_37_13 TaxID=1802579 RepID=A0A1F4SWX1_UNCSA|nr:MAG: acetyl-CoA carboxylase carboxyltransferase subunit alpha [candidate division WOR-1 bacterium RIFOXYA2_FULL_37_7]OGC24956.1 MAG: acetyl-CoA carboxylase carboxyltransferase subunit alpha [candidate division WOR-1 bacterium RIFOXYB2_FULL_37_13]OGC32403.1 MAG: acetyl-CoA carboxylase carboxyltransferase subunit alpha [candidate division WOR-1 bacterium RIFOXYC2_FULL_37_10]